MRHKKRLEAEEARRRATSSDPIDFVADLTPAEVVELYYDWQTWARPNQLIPEGDWWSIWLILAGRGWGKTRSGAEFIRYHVENGLASRVALIAEDAGDARDVMIEGESGLLAISHPKCKPIYVPSKRRVEWPNGAIATVYSDNDPESLRGPQFDLAWCFVAGTMVETIDGPKPIETLGVGDLILTRGGYRKAYRAGVSAVADVYRLIFDDGSSLIGTADHPVWTNNRGWVALTGIDPSDILLGLKGVPWKQSTEVSHSGQPVTATLIWSGVSGLCTASFGLLKEALFRMATLSTTLTATSTTTTSRIWSVFRPLSMPNGITTNPTTSFGQSCASAKSAPSHSPPEFITRLVAARRFLTTAKCALLAALNTKPTKNIKSIVLPNASPSTTCGGPAGSVASHSGGFPQHIAIVQRRVVKKHLEAWNAQTYNLSVENEHEYFANGVLVHNCDELAKFRNSETMWSNLMFGLRLGQAPRVCITTTPKPVPIVRRLMADARVHVTTGTTHENFSNLAPTFKTEIITEYEGTRLGRQELYAEMIDPEDYGIVKRQWFKLWPAEKEFPRFEYIIQSYDCAYTNNTQNDPTACSTWGVFKPSEDRSFCVMLIDCWEEFMIYPDMKKKAIDEFGSVYGDPGKKADLVLIEEKASGLSLIQDLQRAGLPAAGYNPGRADKTQRLNLIANIIERGKVYVPESTLKRGQPRDWADKLVSQVCSFPDSERDDLIDTTSQALRRLRDSGFISIDPEPDDGDYADDGIGNRRVNPYAE